jgi:hypothetical protein
LREFIRAADELRATISRGSTLEASKLLYYYIDSRFYLVRSCCVSSGPFDFAQVPINQRPICVSRGVIWRQRDCLIFITSGELKLLVVHVGGCSHFESDSLLLSRALARLATESSENPFAVVTAA